MASNEKMQSRAYLQQQINGGRSALLAVLILTVVNLVLLVANQDSYFLFSASVPYYLTFFGKLMDNDFGQWPWEKVGTFTITALVIAAAILVVFLLCWLLSKKRYGWLITGLVLFCVDTVALLLVSVQLGTLTDNIMDLLIHAWAIFQLFQGVRCVGALNNLPEEMEPAAPVSPDIEP